MSAPGSILEVSGSILGAPGSILKAPASFLAGRWLHFGNEMRNLGTTPWELGETTKK